MQTYVNPISGGKDPFIMRAPNGLYYSVYSGGVAGTSIYVSESERISEPGIAHCVWTAADGKWNSAPVWAPEIHNLQGKYYIYYTSAAVDCGVEGWPTRRLGVLEAERPLGPYTDKGRLELGEEMSIDGTVLQMPDGRLYFVYMRNKRSEDSLNCLCIAPMSSPTEICGEPVLISFPRYPWEEYVNEGPQALVHGGRVFIMYSANAAHTTEYCLALLECRNTARPLSEDAWIKHEKPVFRKGGNVVGPGHACTVQSPDGTDYLVYHCKSNLNSAFGSCGCMDRMVCVQPFDWGADGLPAFGEPLPTGAPLPLPGGEKEDAEGRVLKDVIRSENAHLIAYGAKEYPTIIENILYLDGKSKSEYGCKAVVKGCSWRDLRAEVDMHMPGGERGGVVFRASDIGARRYMLKGYMAALSPRFGLEILRFDGGEPVRLAYVPIRAKYGEWVRLSVTCAGGSISAAAAGAKLTVNDNTYASGRIGLAAEGDLNWFKNMNVESI